MTRPEEPLPYPERRFKYLRLIGRTDQAEKEEAEYIQKRARLETLARMDRRKRAGERKSRSKITPARFE